MSKFSIRRGGALISLGISCIILLSAFLALYFTVLKPDEKSGAFSSSNTSSYVSTGEILTNSSSATGTYPFNSNLTKLINMIYGSSGVASTQVSSLKSSTASTPLTATKLRAKTYNKTSSQSIVVRLGGLDWIVTYVSNDTSGNLIATLWLSNNHQSAWGTTSKNLGDHYGFTNGGLYSDWSDDWYNLTAGTYPSNMYGTSYIRVETLNNPNNRKYATSNSATTSGTSIKTTTSAHPFALYTYSGLGLTTYLTTPNRMSWMSGKSAKTQLGMSYDLPNDSLTGTGGYYSGNDYSSTSANSTRAAAYDDWGGDYLWLPSLTETGYSGDSHGLWALNNAERSTYDGSTTIISSSTIGSTQEYFAGTAYVYSWSRSASSNSASNRSYRLSHSGDYYSNHICFLSQAVRPALLLNLTKAVSKMAPQSTVTLDRQSGSGGTSSTTATYGSAMPSISVPSRAGYTFNGYYSGTSGSGTKYYTVTGASARTCDFTSAKTLYAYWTANTYTVAYNSNGGSGTTASSSHTYGVSKALTTNGYTNTGYKFLGWSMSSTATSATYTDGQSVSNLTTTKGATVTLYAVWELQSFAVTLNNSPYAGLMSASAGGFENTGWRSGSYDTTHVRSGNYACKVTGAESSYESFAYTSDTFTLDSTNKNHIFYVRYYGYQETLTSGGKTQVYWPEEEPSMGSISLGPAGQWNLYSYRVDRSSNACTAGKYFRIDFDNNQVAGTIWWDDFMAYDLTEIFGAGNEPSKEYCDSLLDIQVSSVTANNGSAMPTITVPTRAGYTFGGYYSGENGSGTQYYTATGASAKTCDLTSATTLYAKWTANTYSITLNTNGGTINAGNVTSYTYGTGATLPTNVTRTGYTFAGWYEDSTFSGSAVTSVTTTDLGNKTYYAKWNAKIILAENISGASGILTGGGTFAEGDNITLTAYAKRGYDFCYWLKDTAQFTNNDTNSITVAVDGDATYTAVFKEAGVKVNNFAVGLGSPNQVGGTVVGENVTRNGESYAYVRAVASTGYSFSGWVINGILSTTYMNSTALIPLSEVRYGVITAQFTSQTSSTLSTTMLANGVAGVSQFSISSPTLFADTSYNITITTNDSSAVGVISGAGSYASGATATLSAYAKKGYQFAYWLKNGASFDGNGTNEVSVTVTGSCSYTAVFLESGAKISTVAVDTVCTNDANIVGCGRVGMASQILDDTTYIVVMAVPMPGYKFVGWAIDGEISTTYTNCNERIAYNLVQGKLISAVFELLDTSKINTDTNN